MKMKMSLFNDCQIALDLGINVGFKKKLELKKTIIEHGGIVSFIVTQKVGSTSFRMGLLIFLNVGLQAYVCKETFI
jgi:hypothetical protein